MKFSVAVIFSVAFLQAVFACQYFTGLGGTCGSCDHTNPSALSPTRFPGLSCIQSYWQCPSKTQIYDAIRKLCRGISGTPCNAKNICVDNAECGVNGTCECKTGYRENSEGSCIKTFGDPCTTTDECQMMFPMFPSNEDSLAGLICDEVCKCPFGDIFRYNNTCEKAVGSSCKNDLECQRTSMDLICDRVEKKCKCPFFGDIFPLTSTTYVNTCRSPLGVRCGGSPCVDNAQCYIPPIYNIRCQCIDGFEPDNSGACVPLPLVSPPMAAQPMD